MIQCLYDTWKKYPDSPYVKYYMAGSWIVVDNPCFHGYNGFQDNTIENPMPSPFPQEFIDIVTQRML